MVLKSVVTLLAAQSIACVNVAHRLKAALNRLKLQLHKLSVPFDVSVSKVVLQL
jgi:hypothetical protein